jgi:hypothetical protein
MHFKMPGISTQRWGSQSWVCAVGAKAPYSYGLLLAGTPPAYPSFPRIPLQNIQAVTFDLKNTLPVSSILLIFAIEFSV